MAIYAARWICPTTRRPRFREFHTKREADSFQALPRDHLVFVERCKDVEKDDHHR